jgi:hypothetical protein
MITTLLKAGADIKVQKKDVTALVFAAGFSENPEVIKVLVWSGDEDNAGKTASG